MHQQPARRASSGQQQQKSSSKLHTPLLPPSNKKNHTLVLPSPSLSISLPRPPRRKGVQEQAVSRSPFLLDQQQQPQLACINHSSSNHHFSVEAGRTRIGD
ncbi:hypothetical protein POPTR_018G072801v4 [Populus trichocarpa]|uniref:Uncharacterized protein n=1 Tax=Populus trichocarpa TaxID=3694 RepID=A0A3N7I4H9_POPTR|nr:hypothetical protein POPTR_018G072801v4 [Populus trichocarpa]